MSESEKPFEATPGRIRKAKREGNVARSSEFAANIAFAAAALSIVALAPLLGASGCRCIVDVVASSNLPAPQCALILVVALIPVGSALLAGTCASVFQNGGLIVIGIAPNFQRLHPVEGLKRICSRETLGHTARATLAFACALGVMVPLVTACSAAMLDATMLRQVAVATWNGARAVGGAALAVGLLFSVAEYGAARNVWLRKLRMSFDDRKRETKEEEGDAFARGRRRTLHRAMLVSGISRVKAAAFVVANPSHVSIALEYRPPAVPVPRILVRAVGELALRVRQLARGHGIPVVEDVALARALFSDGRVGEAIPHAHYVAVAEVVAALMRARERAP